MISFHSVLLCLLQYVFLRHAKYFGYLLCALLYVPRKILFLIRKRAAPRRIGLKEHPVNRSLFYKLPVTIALAYDRVIRNPVALLCGIFHIFFCSREEVQYAAIASAA